MVRDNPGCANVKIEATRTGAVKKLYISLNQYYS